MPASPWTGRQAGLWTPSPFIGEGACRPAKTIGVWPDALTRQGGKGHGQAVCNARAVKWRPARIKQGRTKVRGGWRNVNCVVRRFHLPLPAVGWIYSLKGSCFWTGIAFNFIAKRPPSVLNRSNCDFLHYKAIPVQKQLPFSEYIQS